jgi:hypothetical protein
MTRECALIGWRQDDEPGSLEHPPIDHVCAGPGKRRTLNAEAEGWDCTVDGARLSDHGGVLASLELAPVRSRRSDR